MDYLYLLITFASGYVLGWLLTFGRAKFDTRRMKADYEMLLDGYRDSVTTLNKSLRDVSLQRDVAIRTVKALHERNSPSGMN